MTSRDEMVKLRERVREAKAADREIDAQVYVACESYARGTWCEADGAAVNVYKGATRINRFSPLGYSESIDAALDLCERVLPGCYVSIETPPGRGADNCAFITIDDHDAGAAWSRPSAPLAILDALLSALIQKDTSHVGS